MDSKTQVTLMWLAFFYRYDSNSSFSSGRQFPESLNRNKEIHLRDFLVFAFIAGSYYSYPFYEVSKIDFK